MPGRASLRATKSVFTTCRPLTRQLCRDRRYGPGTHQCVGFILGGPRGLLLLQDGFDVVLHFGQRLGVRILLVVDMKDDKRIASVDHVTGATLGQRECGFLDIRDGETTTLHPADGAAVLATGIFGIFLREIFEFASGLELLQNVVGFLACRF